jgi:hypothetical protein
MDKNKEAASFFETAPLSRIELFYRNDKSIFIFPSLSKMNFG